MIVEGAMDCISDSEDVIDNTNKEPATWMIEILKRGEAPEDRSECWLRRLWICLWLSSSW